jgi:hypothetical protein
MQKNNWRWLPVAAAASYGIGLSIHTFASRADHASLAAGWFTGMTVLVLAHLCLTTTQRLQPTRAMAVGLIIIIARLLILLVITIVVLFTGVFDGGVFLMGLLPAYLAGLAWEITCIAAPGQD